MVGEAGDFMSLRDPPQKPRHRVRAFSCARHGEGRRGFSQRSAADERSTAGRRPKSHIYGPKPDGTYVVEFKMADGEALAISIPASETRVVRYFQERMPVRAVRAGHSVRDIHFLASAAFC